MNEIPDLHLIFEEWSRSHFGGNLPAPILRWNSRLRSSAGRFIPGRRSWTGQQRQSVIEIATYLREEVNSIHHIRDTMGHEMIHYYLFLEGLPYGHGPEFRVMMQRLGVSRYNKTPRRQPEKYLYFCWNCGEEFRVRRKWRKPRACKPCCVKHNGGRYSERFRLDYRFILEGFGL